MKKIIYILLLISCISIQSCRNDEDPVTTEKTLMIYMPWSPSLYSHFQQNIADLMNAIQQEGLHNQRVVGFMCYKDASERDNKIYGRLFELKFEKGRCVEVPLDVFTYQVEGTQAEFMTASGMAKLISKMKQIAPAKEYSLILGSHGEGWLPVTRSRVNINTRWVGGDIPYYQTEINTLKQALEKAGVKLNFLLLDDCNMSNVEVAFELKDVTDYIVASPTEILIYGMPYHKIGRYLLGTPNYQMVCDEFKSFYSTYVDELGQLMPYGTIGVIKTEKLLALADAMKKINAKYTIESTNSIQKMDGYIPTIFYDFRDYAQKLIKDEVEVKEIEDLLQEVVPYKSNTEYYYSDWNYDIWKINIFTGMTISDPSIHSKAIGTKKSTSWWIATH